MNGTHEVTRPSSCCMKSLAFLPYIKYEHTLAFLMIKKCRYHYYKAFVFQVKSTDSKLTEVIENPFNDVVCSGSDPSGLKKK